MTKLTTFCMNKKNSFLKSEFWTEIQLSVFCCFIYTYDSFEKKLFFKQNSDVLISLRSSDKKVHLHKQNEHVVDVVKFIMLPLKRFFSYFVLLFDEVLLNPHKFGSGLQWLDEDGSRTAYSNATKVFEYAVLEPSSSSH